MFEMDAPEKSVMAPVTLCKTPSITHSSQAQRLDRATRLRYSGN